MVESMRDDSKSPFTCNEILLALLDTLQAIQERQAKFEEETRWMISKT